MTVYTDAVAALAPFAALFYARDAMFSLRLKGPAAPPPLAHPFLLAHEYKRAWEAAVRRSAAAAESPTAFACLEDDMEVTLEALLSWAEDHVQLDAQGWLAKGYSRQFYRYERWGDDGRRYLVERSPADARRIAAFPALLAKGAVDWDAPSGPYLRLEQPDGGWQYFAAVVRGYSAVTLASRDQVAHWVGNPLFRQARHRQFPVREFAASGMQYDHGLFHNVLPLRLVDQGRKVELDPSAAVHHLSNKCVKEGPAAATTTACY